MTDADLNNLLRLVAFSGLCLGCSRPRHRWSALHFGVGILSGSPVLLRGLGLVVELAYLVDRDAEPVGDGLGDSRSGRSPAGVVRLVEDDQVPRLGIVDERGAAVPSGASVAGRDLHRFFVPAPRVDLVLVVSPQRAGRVAAQLAPVVDRPVEVELLA